MIIAWNSSEGTSPFLSLALSLKLKVTYSNVIRQKFINFTFQDLSTLKISGSLTKTSQIGRKYLQKISGNGLLSIIHKRQNSTIKNSLEQVFNLAVKMLISQIRPLGAPKQNWRHPVISGSLFENHCYLRL